MDNIVADFTININEPLQAEFVLENSQTFNALFQINATPEKVSQLENDLNFQTAEQVEESIQEAIGDLNISIEGSALIDVIKNDNTATIISKSYVFEQGIPSNTWVINHNLNKRPSIDLVDSSGRRFEADREYTSNNQVIIHLEAATTGYAYLN